MKPFNWVVFGFQTPFIKSKGELKHDKQLVVICSD